MSLPHEVERFYLTAAGKSRRFTVRRLPESEVTPNDPIIARQILIPALWSGSMEVCQILWTDLFSQTIDHVRNSPHAEIFLDRLWNEFRATSRNMDIALIRETESWDEPPLHNFLDWVQEHELDDEFWSRITFTAGSADYLGLLDSFDADTLAE